MDVATWEPAAQLGHALKKLEEYCAEVKRQCSELGPEGDVLCRRGFHGGFLVKPTVLFGMGDGDGDLYGRGGNRVRRAEPFRCRL